MKHTTQRAGSAAKLHPARVNDQEYQPGIDYGELHLVAAVMIHAEIAEAVRSHLGADICHPDGIGHAALRWVLGNDPTGMDRWAAERRTELRWWLRALENTEQADNIEDARHWLRIQTELRERSILMATYERAATAIRYGGDPADVARQIREVEAMVGGRAAA